MSGTTVDRAQRYQDRRRLSAHQLWRPDHRGLYPAGCGHPPGLQPTRSRVRDRQHGVVRDRIRVAGARILEWDTAQSYRRGHVERVGGDRQDPRNHVGPEPTMGSHRPADRGRCVVRLTSTVHPPSLWAARANVRTRDRHLMGITFRCLPPERATLSGHNRTFPMVFVCP